MSPNRARVLWYLGIGIVIAIFLSITKSFGEKEVAAIDVISGMTSTPFWVLFILGTLVLLIWTGVKIASCASGTPIAQQLRGCAPPVEAFVVLLGVTIFHWLYWSVAPNAWGAWFHGQLFWPMNAAIVLVAFFWSQQGAPARYAGRTLGALVLIAIGVGTYGYFRPANEGSETNAPSKPQTAAALTADTVLPIIAECESGGRQFDDAGNLVISPTDDVGKYQIHLPDHWGRAESLGIKLSTEEGNEKFARLLYSENGTDDWNSSRSCWEPKLIALGLTPTTGNFTVLAGVDCTKPIPVTRRFQWSSDPIGVKYRVQVDNGKPVDFPIPDGQYYQLPDGKSIRFCSLETEPVIIVVKSVTS